MKLVAVILILATLTSVSLLIIPIPMPYSVRYRAIGRVVPVAFDTGPNCILQQPIHVSRPLNFSVNYDSSSLNGCRLVTLRNRASEEILVTFLFINSTGLSGLRELKFLFRNSSYGQTIVDNSTFVQDDNVALEISGYGDADIWLYLKADFEGRALVFFKFYFITLDSEQIFSINVVFTIFF